jgi:Regulator of chromosome condensation (RCC1) repeat
MHFSSSWGALTFATLAWGCTFTGSLGSGDADADADAAPDEPAPAEARTCGDIPHGGSEQRERYAKSRVAFDQSCVSEVQLRTCDDGELSAWSGSFDADSCLVEEECADGAARTAPAPCGLNGRGVAEQRCEQGRWQGPSACADPDVCVDGDVEDSEAACGLNGRGAAERRCVQGAWEEPATCDDSDLCVDGSVETTTAGCGLNGRGTESKVCATGQWQRGSCDDADECVDGESRSKPAACGLNGRGTTSESCELGAWRLVSCEDPDSCKDGSTEAEACGVSSSGQRVRLCEGGAFGDFSACDEPSAKQVAAFGHRTCVLLEDGAARCWGENFSGEGNVPEGERFQRLAAADRATCGLRLDGTVRCWGSVRWTNWSVPEGQLLTLGSGESGSVFTGLLLDGRFTRWGYLYDTLDYGGVFVKHNPESAAFSAIEANGAVFWSAPGGFEYYRPSGVLPPSESPYIDSANGCGLRADGTVHCLSSLGVQPSATLTGRYTKLFNWRGRSPELKVLCALDTEGRVDCELDEPSPAPPPGAGYVSVAAGTKHSCGVTPSGELRCAGNFPGFAPPLPAEERFTRLSGGTQSVCGRRVNGSWTCWGPLGSYPTPEEAFPSVAVGAYNACGLREDGTAVCWGSESTGVNVLPNVLRYTQLDLGDVFACGATTAETSDSAVTCWGREGQGGSARREWYYSLGAPADFVSVGSNRYLCIRSGGKVRCGYSDRRLELVAGAEELATFEAGGENLCGLSAAGEARCFGYSGFNPPAGVFQSLVIEGSACGLRPDGSVECFGHRLAGTANVPRGETFVQLAAGLDYTCGLRADGSVRCWGFDDFGQAAWPPPGD